MSLIKQIDFYINKSDRLNYICRLIRKIYNLGKLVTVFGDESILNQIDDLLWIFSPIDFIPHCNVGDNYASEIPVVFCVDSSQSPHQVILLNLSLNIPPDFFKYERLLEVIGNSSKELNAGRQRYRFYQQQGYNTVINF